MWDKVVKNVLKLLGLRDDKTSDNLLCLKRYKAKLNYSHPHLHAYYFLPCPPSRKLYLASVQTLINLSPLYSLMHLTCCTFHMPSHIFPVTPISFTIIYFNISPSISWNIPIYPLCTNYTYLLIHPYTIYFSKSFSLKLSSNCLLFPFFFVLLI